MKATALTCFLTCFAQVPLAFGQDAPPPAKAPEPAAAPAAQPAADEKPENPLEKHQQGSTKVADEQDNLSGEVDQLTLEQTVPKVIELFEEVSSIMDEATDWLAENDTGGRTIAAQTEVLEKIFEATKERQKQQGGGKAGGAMMDMMEKMMDEGQEKESEPKKGDKPSDKGGGGMTGDSDAANEASGGAGDGKNEARRVPKAGGITGSPLPEEFRKALDAYNRGMEQKVK